VLPERKKSMPFIKKAVGSPQRRKQPDVEPQCFAAFAAESIP
jgi:hypothetical protein